MRSVIWKDFYGGRLRSAASRSDRCSACSCSGSLHQDWCRRNRASNVGRDDHHGARFNLHVAGIDGARHFDRRLDVARHPRHFRDHGGLSWLLGPVFWRNKSALRKWALPLLTLFAAPLSAAQTRFGIDNLQRDDFDVLRGRRVALITNQTGVDASGDKTADILLEAKGVTLVCLMTPEHGFLGTVGHGESIQDGTYKGLPVYSLYGKTNRPTDQMLKSVNTVVFDIQDVGTRFYTYITTMGMALEETAKHKLKFVVLDRPNPIRGDIREGDVLDDDTKRMTGYFPLPVRHGLTVGEIATWMNATEQLHADLSVVRMTDWKRKLWYDQAGWDFVPPSPNIRSLVSAVLYPGIGCFEATNIAVGRGTDRPFELIGAPWIKANELCAVLREKNFPGLLFEPVSFTPTEDAFKDQLCHGIRIIVTDRDAVRPFALFLTIFQFLVTHNAAEFKPEWEEVRVVTGSNLLRDAAEKRIPWETLPALYDQSLQRFEEAIRPYLLYN